LLANWPKNGPHILCLEFHPSIKSFFIADQSSALAICIPGRWSCGRWAVMRVLFLLAFPYLMWIGVSLSNWAILPLSCLSKVGLQSCVVLGCEAEVQDISQGTCKFSHGNSEVSEVQSWCPL
jgi:hypothetical protein